MSKYRDKLIGAKDPETGLLICPICGTPAFEGDFYGTYDICEVCGWEDDEVQFVNHNETGANRMTINEAREAWAQDRKSVV